MFIYLFFSYQVYTGGIRISEYTVLLGSTTLFFSLLGGFFDNLASLNKTLKYTGLFREYRDFVTKNSNISLTNTLSMPEINKKELLLTFENVSFTYPGTNREILKNINFTIKSGEKIGIVGRNGSGKTTLIKLICRLYEPSSGRIFLNGIDIASMPLDGYSKLIGIVLQDFCLFAYSVRENILFDSSLDERRLFDCVKKSGLSRKIDSLPKGIDTSVEKSLDDSGVEFSGGEGQKLAIARAIYKDAPFLILDEPTASLDAKSESEIYSNFFRMSKDKTTLFISHRLAASTIADKIVVLHDGCIVESGNHHELLQKNGLYAQMYQKQRKPYVQM